jgi:hypothetical protein
MTLDVVVRRDGTHAVLRRRADVAWAARQARRPVR